MTRVIFIICTTLRSNQLYQYIARQFNMKYFEVSSLLYKNVEEMLAELNQDLLKASV